jgi:hypothetical protein
VCKSGGIQADCPRNTTEPSSAKRRSKSHYGV